MKDDMKKDDVPAIVEELAKVQQMSLDELLEKVKALAAQLDVELDSESSVPDDQE